MRPTPKDYIALAKICGNRGCHPRCPHFPAPQENCRDHLIADLAQLLEETTTTIYIGDGENYEVKHHG